MEETGVLGENHRTAASHCQTLSHKVVLSTPRHELYLVLFVDNDFFFIHELSNSYLFLHRLVYYWLIHTYKHTVLSNYGHIQEHSTLLLFLFVYG